MNGLDWRNLWELAVIEHEQRETRLEQRRIWREMGIAPGMIAPLLQTVGGVLIAAGQRLAGEPRMLPARAAHAA